MASEEKLLEELEKDTVDTTRWRVDDEKEAQEAFEIAEYKTRGGVAIPQVDGTLRAWHVTDEPGKVIDLLKGLMEFYPREGDLCSGLYVSASPAYWRGRSERRWNFLKEMTREQRSLLYQAVYDRLAEQARTHYITENEWGNAQRIMAQAMTDDYWPVLGIVADQPFNVNIQKLAKELGLATPFEPHEVPVDFEGRYLEFNTTRAINAYKELLKKRYGTLENVSRTDLCDMLESYGWDGIYTQSGFGTNPELVIWNPKRIIRFGDWERPIFSTSLSGRRERLVLWDPDSRFEGHISINRQLADIIDLRTGNVFLAMTKRKLGILGMIAKLMLGAEEDPEASELLELQTRDDMESKGIFNRLQELSEDELRQLVELLEEMLPVMA